MDHRIQYPHAVYCNGGVDKRFVTEEQAREYFEQASKMNLNVKLELKLNDVPDHRSEEPHAIDLDQDWLHVFRLVTGVALRRLINQYDLEQSDPDTLSDYLHSKGLLYFLEEVSTSEMTSTTYEGLEAIAEKHFQKMLDEMYRFDSERRPLDEAAQVAFAARHAPDVPT